MKYLTAIILVLMSTTAFAGDRSKQITCLAMNMYHEARSERTQGKLAVAMVTMNRVKSGRFPNTVCKVVWQNRQFSWTQDGKKDYPYERAVWRKAVKMARWVYDNYDKMMVATSGAIDVTGGALFYYAHNLVNPYWAHSIAVTRVIGGHTFGTVRERG